MQILQTKQLKKYYCESPNVTRAVDDVVHVLALEDKLKSMPNNLSGGQQQRVAIARALVTKPAILLADEPTGNLDSKSSADVLGLLKLTGEKFNQTIVMITHNNDIALLADRIIHIEDGRVDPDTGEIIKAYIFVGVMTYSQYAYVEACMDMKQKSWINAHIHMYEYFGGVARILVPDNCKTAVVHNGGFKDQQINETYQEMAEHYGTAIIPARVRSPKDKPNAEGTVGNISTWITAALRNEQFFSLAELNRAIRDKLELFNQRLFQKKEGSRRSLFLGEEKPLLAPLPATRFELSDWKTATVQFNYHISVDGMLYSVPYEYIKKKVDVKVTDTTIEIFYNHNRIASHRRLKGRTGQYSTVTEHMPEDHQKYLEWNGDRFRKWAERIGINTYTAVNAVLTSKGVEQQTYRSCMGLLKLAEKYSDALLEAACKKALSYTASPSYKSIKNILVTGSDKLASKTTNTKATQKARGITRGADYYRR